jgi:hypothetical protein
MEIFAEACPHGHGFLTRNYGNSLRTFKGWSRNAGKRKGD